ncbi:MAG: AzlD domain-containing protein [Colwellia sp.]|nr:AzlD domain-containing protein [Colwellia sp.]MCW8864802.1 AzlD domain-containing protein [Colwellia sp.]MCW9081037.1 AzlD domain-containing protein [Colwellia sp.]
MLLTILLLACITFTSRYLFLAPKLPLRIGAKITHFLSFSAPAVLTAIWVPIIFVKDNSFNGSLSNPYLLAATVAIITAYKSQSVYLTLSLSITVFALLHFIN